MIVVAMLVLLPAAVLVVPMIMPVVVVMIMVMVMMMVVMSVPGIEIDYIHVLTDDAVFFDFVDLNFSIGQVQLSRKCDNLFIAVSQCT